MNSSNNVTYYNTLNNISKTRILADRNMVLKDKNVYEKSQIFFMFNEHCLDNKFSILVVGSNDVKNPYFGGFFFFDGLFPDQYPFFPPRVVATTQGEGMRFHPNFYTNGKCCLSILGTWSGPPWTSCQNISTIAHTIQSLYIHNPITQEPGWENRENSIESKVYSRMVIYRTLDIAIYRMLKDTPEKYKCFKNTMIEIFKKNFKAYIDKIESLRYLNGKTEKLDFWRLEVFYDIDSLKDKFENLYKDFFPQEINTISEPKTDNNSSKTKKRYSPNQPAKNYEVGFTMISENDNQKWIVKSTKSGKRWFKV